jgi:hypothetical protein
MVCAKLLKGKHQNMQLSTKERESRSRTRQILAEQLTVWNQREKDMEIAAVLKAPDAAVKMSFVRQEQAKLRQKLEELETGVSKQRAWANGKFLY